MIVSFRGVSALAVVVAGITAGALAAQAASECKPLKEADCKAATTCSWVKAHTIGKGKNKGKEVKAFCRKKAVRKTAAKTVKAPKVPAAGMSGMSGMSAMDAGKAK